MSIDECTYTSGGKIQAWGSGQAPKRGNWPSTSAGLGEEKPGRVMANTLEAAEAKESTVNAIPLILKKNVSKDELKKKK